MNVLIVESPSKAKSINKYLGSEFKVLASVGHVRDLSAKNDAIEKINQILNQITDVDIHQDQNIIFRSVTPLKCINKSKVNKNINIKISTTEDLLNKLSD